MQNLVLLHTLLVAVDSHITIKTNCIHRIVLQSASETNFSLVLVNDPESFRSETFEHGHEDTDFSEVN
jgi:hypothetical protein